MLWLLTLSYSMTDAFNYKTGESNRLLGKFEGTEEEVKAKAETLNPDPEWTKERGKWSKDDKGILTFHYEDAPFFSTLTGWEEIHCIPFDKITEIDKVTEVE